MLICAAFDLEDAHRVGAADHRVDLFVAFGNIGERDPPAVVPANQLETPPDGCQHPQRQAIDLQDAQFVQVVLVPLDHRAVRHGGVLDGHQLAQRAAGHDHAAGVLREVPGKTDELVHQLDKGVGLGGAAEGRIARPRGNDN